MTTRRTWTRRILFAILILALLYGAARLVGGAVSASRLEDELERARATGAPLTLSEALPPPVPDAENAARLLQQAFLLRVEEPDEMWEHFEVLHNDPHALSEDAARMFEAWVEQNGPALAKAEEAVLLPRCRFDLDLEDAWAAIAEHVPGMHGVAQLLSIRGELQIRDGDVDGALRTSGILVRLGHSERAFPSLVDLLVGMGIETVGLEIAKRALAAGHPSPAAARDLAAVLDALPRDETLVPVFTFERAFGLYGFDRAADGSAIEDPLGGLEDEVGLIPEGLRFLLPTTARRLDEARFLALAARALELASQPFPEVREAWAAFTSDAADAPWYDRFAHACVAANETAVRAWEVYRTSVDLARIALRVEIHAVEENGLPASLAALDVPGGIEDRFRKAPYVYRLEGGGYLLYSVGPNGKDENGRETDNPREEGDLVWRRGPRDP